MDQGVTTENARIDYSKYEVDEVVEKIADAIFFPLYIGRVVLSVLLAFIFVIGLLGYFTTNYTILGFFFFMLAFAISIPSLILVSAIRLINTIRNDINRVIEISVETTAHIYNDSKLLAQQRSKGVPLKSSFNDVFRGVSLYVIRPSLIKVLNRKIKFFAYPFTFLIDKIFKHVIIKKQPKFEVHVDDDGKVVVDTQKTTVGGKIKKGGSNVTKVSTGIIKAPLYLLLFIYGSINLILVLLLSWIF